MVLEAWLEVLRAIPLPRVLVALASVGVVPPMLEMGYSHYRGNYHRWPMYIPVAFPPLFAVAGFLLLGVPEPWTWWLYAAMSAGLMLVGFLGAFFHVQGTARQTGGFNLDNVMVGPPLVAPLSFTVLGVLGLVALAYWS